ncbi:hypothetical protein SAMN05443662_0323 [Sulfurivirga caldicuralii]|uniref:Uncharacterized protein n=1 Tax=Sulfurivirga caldicuralii TaxID=364032 RepID=A0A1N6DPH5_9GAMM|nr:hypothetical protein [Sulfurivirga caldicuralii]SIN72650.1 hypothetical protein SAMN05443662_0323 [Sulfurivirga caldicuralii]
MGQRKPSLDTRVAEWERKVQRPLKADEAKRLAALLRVLLQSESPPSKPQVKSLKH